MKKFLLFAAACIALVACNQKEEVSAPLVPGEVCTLTATVNIGNSSNTPIRMVSPNTPISTTEGGEVSFHWEKGDQVILKNASGSSTFTIIDDSISADGKSAKFTGTALSDMSSYEVYYGYANGLDAVQELPYLKDSTFRPFIQGTSNSTGFTLNSFMPVLKIKIAGGMIDDAIFDSLVYKIGANRNVAQTKARMAMPAGFIIPKSEPMSVFFPVPQTNNGDSMFICIYYRSNSIYALPCKIQGTAFNLSEHMSEVVNFNTEIVLAACLAAGTRITMADGSLKKVEDIKEGDLVRTFDHEAGKLSSAPICLAWKGDHKESPLCLTFASGKTLSIIGTHDLILENTRKYVRVNEENVASYVGKRFYNVEQGDWDALVSYKKGEPVDFYCPYTKGHINCIAEGMLTLPDDVDYLVNIYELDTNLKADADQLAADIAKYGLFDVTKVWPELTRYHQLIEDLGSRYYYISIGKGLIPESYLEVDRDYWNNF